MHAYNYPLRQTQNQNPRSLTRNPNQGHLTGRATPYKLINKTQFPQGVQLDLNLSPDSWRLPHQTQSCLARRRCIMASLGPDWLGMTVPMLWRTRFSASNHSILLWMGSQTLKVLHGNVRFQTIRFVRSSSCHGERLVPSLHQLDAASLGNVAALSRTLRELLQSHTLTIRGYNIFRHY
jgi:hypothetical protein